MALYHGIHLITPGASEHPLPTFTNELPHLMLHLTSLHVILPTRFSHKPVLGSSPGLFYCLAATQIGCANRDPGICGDGGTPAGGMANSVHSQQLSARDYGKASPQVQPQYRHRFGWTASACPPCCALDTPDLIGHL